MRYGCKTGRDKGIYVHARFTSPYAFTRYATLEVTVPGTARYVALYDAGRVCMRRTCARLASRRWSPAVENGFEANTRAERQRETRKRRRKRRRYRRLGTPGKRVEKTEETRWREKSWKKAEDERKIGGGNADESGRGEEKRNIEKEKTRENRKLWQEENREKHGEGSKVREYRANVYGT